MAEELINIQNKLELFFYEKTDVSIPLLGLKKNNKIAFSYVIRGIIGKIYMQELWFLHMIRLLNVLYKCMKFP